MTQERKDSKGKKKVEKPTEQATERIGKFGDAIIGPTKGDDTAHMRLHLGGRVYKTRFTKKFVDRKKWVTPNPLEVVSHIPGSVIEIYIKPNQRVKKGESLMIYEAMKMKNVVTAPFDGEIDTITAKVGDHLPKGALLLTFKRQTDSTE